MQHSQVMQDIYPLKHTGSVAITLSGKEAHFITAVAAFRRQVVLLHFSNRIKEHMHPLYSFVHLILQRRGNHG